MVVRLIFSSDGSQRVEIVPIQIRLAGPAVLSSDDEDYAEVVRRAEINATNVSEVHH
jgi:hypothetical protein